MGDIKHATLDGVFSTIMVLGKVAPNVVSVKRKYKTAYAGGLLLEGRSVLKELESNWTSVSMHSDRHLGN